MDEIKIEWFFPFFVEFKYTYYIFYFIRDDDDKSGAYSRHVWKIVHIRKSNWKNKVVLLKLKDALVVRWNLIKLFTTFQTNFRSRHSLARLSESLDYTILTILA